MTKAEVFARGEIVRKRKVLRLPPMRRFTSNARRGSLMSSPRMRMVAAAFGASNLVHLLMVVDLPAPLGPEKANKTVASFLTRRFEWVDGAKTFPKSRVRLVVSMAGVMASLQRGETIRTQAGRANPENDWFICF